MTILNITPYAVILILFLAIAIWVALPLSKLFFRVFPGDLSRRISNNIEKKTYTLIDTSSDREEGWRDYSHNMFLFTGIDFIILLILPFLQDFLPFNPQNFRAFVFFTAINNAMSFVTNANWQVHSEETAASYLTQMAGFIVQNFLSAATGICIPTVVMSKIIPQSHLSDRQFLDRYDSRYLFQNANGLASALVLPLSINEKI